MEMENPTSNWVLTAAPTVFASYVISRSLGLVAICALALAAFSMSPANRLKLAWPCAILPALSLPIVLRWYDSTTMAKAAFFLLACTIIACGVAMSPSRSSALISLIDGAGLFTVASLTLWLAGVKGHSTRTAGVVNTITGGERVIFPLSPSMSASANIAAVYLAAAIPVIVACRRHRPTRLIAIGCAAAVLVLADSRTGLISAMCVSACVVLIPRTFRRFTPPLVGFCLLFPFIYGSLQGNVDWALTSLNETLPWLVRSTLNGRDYVWEAALSYYQSIDDLHQIYGFGIGGPAKSGAAAYYWHPRFSGIASVDQVSPHNSMLQLLFDGGWLTVVVFMAVLICTAVVLARSASTVGSLAALLSLVVGGVTSTALSPTHAEPTWWVLLAVVMTAFAQEPAASTGPINARPNYLGGLQRYVGPDDRWPLLTSLGSGRAGCVQQVRAESVEALQCGVDRGVQSTPSAHESSSRNSSSAGRYVPEAEAISPIAASSTASNSCSLCPTVNPSVSAREKLAITPWLRDSRWQASARE
jgi:hypothetical protein